MKIVKRNPLFFAFLFPAVVDGIMTLVGQNPSYWSKRIVNEASPAYYFLKISPWLFVVGGVVWFALWYWVFKRLKEPINIFLVFLFIAGHSWGSTSWIWNIAKRNNLYSSAEQMSVMFVWAIVIFYFAVIAFFATYSLRVYLDRKN